ncbi:proline-rich protein HaeIII subfamily 1-like, partial [Penaeus monodon]|uniref:proline-rich protein HaeIII subfamily 1-like n=1 Tax=Penaeus monodon TaxID=6687 RepID=UPI0018A725AD
MRMSVSEGVRARPPFSKCQRGPPWRGPSPRARRGRLQNCDAGQWAVVISLPPPAAGPGRKRKPAPRDPAGPAINAPKGPTRQVDHARFYVWAHVQAKHPQGVPLMPASVTVPPVPVLWPLQAPVERPPPSGLEIWGNELLKRVGERALLGNPWGPKPLPGMNTVKPERGPGPLAHGVLQIKPPRVKPPQWPRALFPLSGGQRFSVVLEFKNPKENPKPWLFQ